MKKERTILIACAFSIFLVGCKEKDRQAGTDTHEAKTITLSSIEKFTMDTTYFKEPQLVILETKEESLLSEIKRIFMDDGQLIVFDDQLDKVVMFDTGGKYLRKIDSKGAGPREYGEIADVAIDPVRKQIILLCSAPEKRMYFTYDGSFVKEENHFESYRELITDGNYFYFENRYWPELKNNCFVILNTKTGEIREELSMLDIKHNFYGKGNSLNRGTDILYVRRLDNSIYGLENGRIRKKYQLDFKNHAFPERFFTDNDKGGGNVFLESRENKYISIMSNVTGNDDYMMFWTYSGLFFYDKRNDGLVGYESVLNSKICLGFNYYRPLENTSKVVFTIDEPSTIKEIAERISKDPDNDILKRMCSVCPNAVKEIIDLASKVGDDNNPVLFIYEFKD